MRPHPSRRGPTRGPAPRRRRPRSRARLASLTAVAVATVSMGYAIASSQGSTVHEADLGNGGVWLSSSIQAKFGRLNMRAQQLDDGVAADVAKGSGLDILQDGAAVVGWSRATQQLQAVDPRTATFEDGSVATPRDPEPGPGGVLPTFVDLRGGTLAMVDPSAGKLWATRVDSRAGITQLDALGTAAKPLATVGAGATLAVGVDGTVFAASARTGTVTTLGVTPEGFRAGPPVKVGNGGRPLQLTAVGDTWVAYAAETDLLFTAEQPAGVAAGLAPAPGQPADVALQVPGPEADSVALQDPTHVAMVTLEGRPAPGGVVVEERVGRSVRPPHLSRPVRLLGCVHAAWAEPGQVYYGANCGRTAPVATATVPNASQVPLRDGVAFRVNRGLIALNDLDTGAAWDVLNNKRKIDNWDALIPPPRRDDQSKRRDQDLLDDTARQQPPKAEPDNVGVRPGRTSKLYVLDNDTDAAGSVLAIDPADVSAPTVPGVTVSVAADGQSIDVTVPPQARQDFAFTYKVGNGRVKAKAAAKVAVRLVRDDANTPPHLRKGSARLARTAYPVLAGKQVPIAVAADWRDEESDPVSVTTASEDTQIDGQGRLVYTAGSKAGRTRVPYLADDGRGGTTKGSVDADIVAPTDTRFRPPVTQPDVMRGIVGKPLQLEPLGNDIAGADPSDPEDRMHLAGDIRAVGGLVVDTNLDTGVVTVTPTSPGTFELSYAAQIGGGVAPGRIRIDVARSVDTQALPVAVPDSATLRDQAPTMVDPLANDYSPRADVLVTQGASVDADSSWLRASVYQGRWVRVQALDPFTGAPGATRRGVVSYVVSDGSKRATGQITVSQKAVALLNPVVNDDKATVREGDTVGIGVLDNDTMADGIPLTIDPTSVKVRGGQQNAFVSGNVIRYVPELTRLTTERQVTVEYAAFPEGMPERAQTGRVTVTVTPLPSRARPNRAPVARSFSASVTAGDPLTITVPTSGVDVDGDTVAIRGIVGDRSGAVSLRYGRVMSIGPSSIRYEAFPTAAGTEVLNYEVSDRFGAKSRAFVRIGVVAPGDPQPPVAVDDTVTAAPGKRVTVPVTRNDLIARGDSVDLLWKGLNPGADPKQWTVDEEGRTIATTVRDVDQGVQQLVYGIDNGIFDPSKASVLVRSQQGFVNPPVALDDVAQAKPGQSSVDVDVLANDSDIDSAPGTLKITDVLSPNASVVGGKVRVTILPTAYTAPYVIEDEDGARAMAVVYVPAGNNGDPYVVSGALITMDTNSSVTVDLADYVTSPQKRTLGIVSGSTVAATPADGLGARASDSDTIRLTSTAGYIGPAALMLQVTDRQGADVKDVHTVYVSIPVQVGPKVPLMRCPSTALVLNAGGLDRRLDIPTVCHAWLPEGMTMDDVEFTTSWRSEPRGVEMAQDGPGRRLVTLRAAADAPSGTGQLVVGVKGSDRTGLVTITVHGVDPPKAAAPTQRALPVPLPRLRPMTIIGLKEGQSQTVDVAAYLDSPLKAPQCQILAAAVSNAAKGVTLQRSGCRLTVTAGAQPSPLATVDVAVTDSSPERAANGRVTVSILGRPGPPTAVRAIADREAGGQARVSWTVPAYDGGSPISGFTVYPEGGPGGTQVCTASPCTISGLRNGTAYTFFVSATNGVDEGPRGGPSNPATPDTRPGATGGVTMRSRGDGSLVVGWAMPDNKGSQVTTYLVRLTPTSGGGSARTVRVGAPATQASVSGLDNEVEYSVAVQAYNAAGAGPFGTAVRMQSAGAPPAVPAARIASDGVGPAKDSATLSLSWDATRPNGPALTGYSVLRRVTGGGWQTIATTAPNDLSAKDVVAYDGTRYEYAVTATNGAGLTSPAANVSSFTSDGQPSTPSVSASTPRADHGVDVVVTVGQPRSSGFARIRWSVDGRSDTVACGCAPGSQKTFTIPGVSNGAKAVTVWTVNTAGRESSQATSNEVSPYGPTPTPNNGRSSTNDRTVTFSWNLPEDGRSIDQVQIRGDKTYNGGPVTSTSVTGGYATTYTIRVRSHAPDSGWSGWLDISGRTDNPPPPPSPAVTAVRQTDYKGYTYPGGSGDCTSGGGGCPKVDFDISGFDTSRSYTYRCWSEVMGYAGGSHTLVVRGPQVWDRGASGYCLFGHNVGRVKVVVSSGGSVYAESTLYPWPPY